MKRRQGWLFFIIFLLTLSVYLLINYPLQLGLDLQGGSQLTLQIIKEEGKVTSDELEADNSVIDKIVNTFKENNIRVNINNNPPNIINNNNVIRNNYSKPNYNNNSRSNNYIKPPTFNNNSGSSYNSRPVISNSTRSSNTNISRGNSRGKN